MKLRSLSLALAGLTLVSAGAFAQTFASLDNITTGYVQNFDTLPSTGTGVAIPAAGTGAPRVLDLSTINSALTGFFSIQTGGTGAGGGTATFVVDNGSSGSGGPKSLGETGLSDRALGSTASGTSGTVITAVRIRNNTGAAISLFGLDFDVEQYRSATSQANVFDFSYALVPATLDDATFFANVAAGTGFTDANIAGLQDGAPTATNDFTSGTVTTNGPLTPPIVSTFRSEINLGANSSGISLLPGEDIAFRFVDINNTGNDATFGLDNFRAVPEPASMAAMALGLGALAARRRRKSA